MAPTAVLILLLTTHKTMTSSTNTNVSESFTTPSTTVAFNFGVCQQTAVGLSDISIHTLVPAAISVEFLLISCQLFPYISTLFSISSLTILPVWYIIKSISGFYFFVTPYCTELLFFIAQYRIESRLKKNRNRFLIVFFQHRFAISMRFILLIVFIFMVTLNGGSFFLSVIQLSKTQFNIKT